MTYSWLVQGKRVTYVKWELTLELPRFMLIEVRDQFITVHVFQDSLTWTIKICKLYCTYDIAHQITKLGEMVT